MKDELEDFINKNREGFDDLTPPSRVWKNVSASMSFTSQSSTHTRWNSVVIWRAAAIIFMVLCAYLLVPKSVFKADTNKTALTEFNDVEAFYVQEISQKVELIESFSEGEENEFTQQFKQLEAMYLVLKEEMKTRPSKKVKDALVLNLLVRIELLNQQLHKLESDDKEDERKRITI